MLSASFLSPQKSAVAAVIVLATSSLAGADHPDAVLVVLRNQPAYQIVSNLLSPTVMKRKAAEASLRLAKDGRSDAGQQLLAARLAETREAAAEIRAATSPEQDYIAARLMALGAANIRHYTALNMLGAEIPDAALDGVKQWPEVAELITVGSHQALLDDLEKALSSPSDLSVPVVNDGDAAFLRVIDRIIDDRDALVAGGDGASAFNTAPASEYSTAKLADFGTFSHLPVKAVQLNGADSHYVSNSVSSDRPFLFYTGRAEGGFRSTLAWDRHFGEGLQPMLRNLNLFVYKADDGAELAAAASPGQSIQEVALPEGGDLLMKVRLQSVTEPDIAAETFALAVSTPGFQFAQGPSLSVKCASSDCTVVNGGDLPALNVVARGPEGEHKLGTIAAGSSAQFTFGKDGSGVTVTSESFGETFIANPSVTDPCTSQQWTISPSAVTLDSSNAWTATVSVAPPPACVTPWMAWFGPGSVNQVLYVANGGAFTTGPGSVTVMGDQNPPISPFTGTVYITQAELAGPYATFGVTDIGATAPPPCTFAATLSSNSLTPFAYTGGAGSISISATPSTCAYTIVSGAGSWLMIGGAGGGSGTGVIGFSVTPNLQPNGSTPQRSGVLTVNGLDNNGNAVFTQSFTITQNGLICAFTPPQSVPNIPAAGIPAQSFTLAISNAACQWTASSGSPDFIVVQNDGKVQSGTLAGTITYSASSANTTTTPKAGYMQAGGHTVDVFQDPKKDDGAPTTFDGLVLAYEPDFHIFVALAPGDITVKEKQSGNVVAANVANAENDSSILKIAGLDAKKTYVITLNLRGYQVSVNNLEISKAQPVASFDVQLQIPAGQRKVTVTVVDANGEPIRGAALKVRPLGNMGESGDDGKWSFLLPKDDKSEFVKVQANGFTFRKDEKDVNGENKIEFRSEEFAVSGKVIADLNSFDPKDDLNALLSSISISAQPALPVMAAGVVVGAEFRWSARGLKKGTDYTFKFSSTELNFNPAQVIVKNRSDADSVTASKRK